MGRAFRKNLFRDIRSGFGRYLAIVAIIALGAGFFTGLKVTNTDMMETGDAYFKRTSLFDFRALSTLGYEEASVKTMEAAEGVEKAEGLVTKDVLVAVDGSERALKCMMLTEEVNKAELVSGRWPEREDECLLDSYNLRGISLGTTVTVSERNDADTLDTFKIKVFTVVGFARTPLYVNFERGTTSIGGGSLDGFFLVPAAALDTEVYTEIALTLSNPGTAYSDAYKASLEAAEDSVLSAAELAADERYNRLLREAEEELTDGLKEYADGVAEYLDGIEEYEDGCIDYATGVKEYKSGIYAYEEGLSEWETSQEAARLAGIRLHRSKKKAKSQIKKSKEALDKTQEALEQQKQAVENAPLPAEQKQAALREIEQGMQQVEAGRQTVAESETELDRQTSSAYSSLGYAREELSDAELELLDAKLTLLDAEQELLDAASDLAEAEEELLEARIELRDARYEITRGRQKLYSVRKPDVYVLNRETNVGYVCYENDADIVSGIATVFPFFFFAVAALVCVTTTNRLVDEQRGQIGIFKALGYRDGVIISRYLFYTGSASLIGVLVGVIGGSLVFPPIIFMAYQMMYSMPDIVLVYDTTLMLYAGGSYLALALLVTYFSCRKELVSPAAELIRPKSPPAGKRILLEHIGFIWKKLKFLHKVSLRNVFRYKKRFLMMVLGIGGCTALLLTGLGLNDSITRLADRQYGEISLYDALVTYSEDKSGREQKTVSAIGAETVRAAFLYSTNADCRTEAASGTVNLMGVGDFSSLTGLMDFHTKAGEPLQAPKTGGCLISRNMADKYGLAAGNTFTLTVDDTQTVPLTVEGVYDNVIYHYVYTSLDSLRPYIGELPLKTAYLGCAEGTDVHAWGAKIAEGEDAAAVQLTTDMLTRVNNTLQSMQYVVLLVIACAGALSFIVLFNLTNINIQERIREIATIKVLGFYNGESARYIFRENYILTFCGCAAGIPMGIWLHNYVIGQIKIDMMAFEAVRSTQSYAGAALLTFLFTIAVNLIMRPRLDRIKMAESLKSIE